MLQLDKTDMKNTEIAFVRRPCSVLSKNKHLSFNTKGRYQLMCIILFQFKTETALVKVCNDLQIAVDERLVSLLVLSATFDTTDLNILLQRLKHYAGIKVTALCWFKSYLSNRYHFVHVKYQSSSCSTMSYDVPQVFVATIKQLKKTALK